jgi:hyaluronoglucosaminidase
MHPPLGLIEGFYGKPWSWQARALTVVFLAAHAGYRSYLYAPKADQFLRRRWQELHPTETTSELAALSCHCREVKVRFGVGLSPYEIYRDFDAEAKVTLAAKLTHLDEIGIDDLAILFDDMRGDLPKLAQTQVEIVHWVREHSRATRLIVCPTYYTDDPLLDRFFGARPPDYLEEFGRTLAPGIEIFWTGEEVCSKSFSPEHLARVEAQLGRKPFLWDNYPVNDGPRMSPFLHLRAFAGRPSSIGTHIAAHGINVASQPVLSRIPALTLAESYERGDAYDSDAAFMRAAEALLGPELAGMVRDDLEVLQDGGRDAARHLRARYAEIDHPAAREIVAWLDGFWSITREEIESQ